MSYGPTQLKDEKMMKSRTERLDGGEASRKSEEDEAHEDGGRGGLRLKTAPQSRDAASDGQAWTSRWIAACPDVPGTGSGPRLKLGAGGGGSL